MVWSETSAPTIPDALTNHSQERRRSMLPEEFLNRLDRSGRLLRVPARGREKPSVAQKHGRTGRGFGSEHVLPRASVEHREPRARASAQSSGRWRVRNPAGQRHQNSFETKVSQAPGNKSRHPRRCRERHYELRSDQYTATTLRL